jgi:hypothetical protein
MRVAFNARAVLLPVVAAALVGGVLGVQLASGGGDFVPARAADPCTVRSATSVSTGIDGLTERLVLLGIDRAACRLGVSREALVLELATESQPTAAEVDALHVGLLQAVDLMKADRTLPKASALSDEALDDSDLNGFVKFLIRALPDSVIDGALKTDDVLKRTIDNLDLRTVLADLNNPDELRSRISAAVTQAVKDALVARLHDLIP